MSKCVIHCVTHATHMCSSSYDSTMCFCLDHLSVASICSGVALCLLRFPHTLGSCSGLCSVFVCLYVFKVSYTGLNMHDNCFRLFVVCLTLSLVSVFINVQMLCRCVLILGGQSFSL